MTRIVNADYERQRFEHLVLGRPRARPTAKAPRRRKPARPVVLAEGIEERVAMREAWSHKAGTPETLEYVEQRRRRPGSLARLYESAAIDKDQLAAAQQIAEAFRAITSDVAVRTASLETRVDGGGHGRAEILAIGRVHSELAYDWWRKSVGGCIDALLAVIVHDAALTAVARDRGISMPRARRMLTDALDLWWKGRRATMPDAALIAD